MAELLVEHKLIYEDEACGNIKVEIFAKLAIVVVESIFESCEIFLNSSEFGLSYLFVEIEKVGVLDVYRQIVLVRPEFEILVVV